MIYIDNKPINGLIADILLWTEILLALLLFIPLILVALVISWMFS